MPSFPKTCPGSHRDQDEIWHRLFGKCGFESLCCINPYIHNLIGMSKFEPMASLAMSLIYNQKSFLEKITPNFDPQHWELLSCKCKLWIGCGQRFVICIASILNCVERMDFVVESLIILLSLLSFLTPSVLLNWKFLTNHLSKSLLYFSMQ